MSDVICRNIINMIYGVYNNLEKCENLNHNLDLSDEESSETLTHVINLEDSALQYIVTWNNIFSRHRHGRGKYFVAL